MDNCLATIYSALGIDWMKKIENTPSGRAYEYVQTAPIGGGEFISNDEIAEPVLNKTGIPPGVLLFS